MRSELVFESPSVAILDVTCMPGPQPPSDVEVEPAFAISFPRQGIYIHDTPAGQVIADPTVALFRSQGDEQTTIHPTHDGDSNTEVQFPASVIEPLLDRQGRFRHGAVAIANHLAVRHHRLLAMARSGTSSALEIEEEAMTLLRLVFFLPLPCDTTERAQTLVAKAREELGASYRESLDLATIARRVGSSPFHLSRVFKRETGRSMTDHRTTLRIRHVLNRLTDGATDLSRLAVEAGFYDHAHMTKEFRRRTGSVPSVMRSLLAG
ncbi:MAG TPA: AraC family transcriptional regulator [Acidimicrobiia bacterium]|nr:AraC family transcriptional regulator [Acidimicrobiia bacterium]